MSSVSLIRPPVWPGLAPGLPEPREIDEPSADAVRTAFGMHGRVCGFGQGDASLPFYRLEPDDRPALFLKLVDPDRCPAAERAEAIAAWLAGQGLPVPSALPGFPRVLPDGRLAVALPYVDGRRTAAEPGDMRRLGQAVALLHRALARHPDRPAWAAATRRRLAVLNAVRSDLAEGRIRLGPDPAALQALAGDPTLDFAPAGTAARPLHGDLNPGNVLIDRVSGSVVLLDFEDVFHSVLPVRFELMLMIERHILVPTEDDDRAAGLIRCLLDGFDEMAGDAHGLPTEPPVQILRTLALRSLCVLAAGVRAGRDGGAAEWGKFLTLEARARARADLLARAVGDRRG